MAWDAEEIPTGVLKDRIQRLQSAMAASGLDAMLLYTNFVRSAAVSYLTAFSPYWADGVLLVPRTGDPVFATTLSKRVGSWIQTVKPVGDLVNSPAPGAVLGKQLAAHGVKRVGILELDAFPSGLYDELAATLPNVAIVDGTETFAAARGHVDIVERRLLVHADAIARDALSHVNAPADVGDAVSTVEKYARAQGAEEIYVAIAPNLDADRRFIRLSGERPLGVRFAIRVTVAYKSAWVRRTKTYAVTEGDRHAIAAADAWFDRFLANAHATTPLSDRIACDIANLSHARLVFWNAETAIGTRPLAVIASAEKPGGPLPHDAALVVTIRLDIGGLPWCGAGLAGLTDGMPA